MPQPAANVPSKQTSKGGHPESGEITIPIDGGVKTSMKSICVTVSQTPPLQAINVTVYNPGIVSVVES